MAKGREVDALLQKFGFIVVRKEREREAGRWSYADAVGVVAVTCCRDGVVVVSWWVMGDFVFLEG